VPAPAGTPDGLLVVLWHSRWAVLLCVLGALAAGVAYIGAATPIYTSTAKLYLDYAGIRISNPYEPGGRPQTDKYLCTQAEIIKSRPILANALKSLLPERLRTFAEAEVPARYLHENLAVEIGKKDEVISVSIRSPYPDEAAQIVNSVVDAYMESRTAHEQRNWAQVLKTLQDELQLARKELEEKQSQWTKYQQDHLPLALGSDSGGVMARYLKLQDDYLQAQIQTLDAERFRGSVKTLAADPLGLRQYVQLRGNATAYASANPEKAPLEARLVEIKTQKERLLETLTADAPKVASLNAEARQIEAQLRQLDEGVAQAVLAAAERQYVEAKDHEAQIARTCREEQQRTVLLNAEAAQYENLRSQVEQLQKYCEAREQEVRDIRKLAGEEVGQLRMERLESALAASVPSEPQKARILAMALILGLLLGGGVAVGRDWLDQTLRSTDEIAALLHVPVLGAVPSMSRWQKMSERGRKIVLQPDSREAEAFRTIRTAVLFSAATQGAQTLLITSPTAGDGKSTLVSNLALAMARAGQKTLVLDADFRKPTQHIIFGLDAQQRCLSDVFAGTMTLAAAVQPTDIEGLHVLTCGYRITNPAEVLHSPEFARLLTCLSETYDRIVVDAPPVTVVTDAQILGALCDATVVILKADKCLRRVAQHAIESLQSVGARLLGVVVNEVHKSGDRYGYYHDRYHKYYGTARKDGTRPPKSSVAAVPDSKALPVGTAPEGAGS